MNKQPSLRDRVVADYFQTTSSAGGAADPVGFGNSVQGIRRRLQPWLDVAGKDALDLGSGTGELCRLLTDAGAARVIGVNLSADEIDYARGQCDAEFVQADIVAYLNDAPAASADRIFAMNILEHLDKEQLFAVLHGATRVLRPGGSLVGMVPNATSPFGGMTRYWDITHENAFTPASLRQLARLVGFRDNIDFRECGPLGHGLRSWTRYVLWQGIRCAIKAWLLVETASTKGGVYTSDMLFRMHKPES